MKIKILLKDEAGLAQTIVVEPPAVVSLDGVESVDLNVDPALIIGTRVDGDDLVIMMDGGELTLANFMGLLGSSSEVPLSAKSQPLFADISDLLASFEAPAAGDTASQTTPEPPTQSFSLDLQGDGSTGQQQDDGLGFQSGGGGGGGEQGGESGSSQGGGDEGPLNQAPVLSGVIGAGVVEDGAVSVSGQLTATDPDSAQFAPVWSLVSDSAGDYGSLSIDQTGQWTYQLNAQADNVQALAEAQTVEETFTVRVEDQLGATDEIEVTVVVTGTNDVPVLSLENSGQLTDAIAQGSLVESGTFSFTDVDAADTHTVTANYRDDVSWDGGSLSAAQASALTAGFSADAEGWNYTVASDTAQFLGDGEALTFSYEVVVDDGHEAVFDTVTLTITGTNDQPVIESVSAGDVAPLLETDALEFFGGELSVEDQDANDSHSFQQTGAASLDASAADAVITDFSVEVTASGVYRVNGNFDALADGETATVVFTYTATDDSETANAVSGEKTVTLLVTGTNDQPVITDVSLAESELDGLESFTGQLVLEDLDATDTHSFQQVGEASVETSAAPAEVTNFSVVLTAEGGYTIEGGFDALAEGETATVTFSYTATDDSGTETDISEEKTVTLTVTGSNDQPVVTDVTIGDSTPVLEAGGVETFSGQLLLSEDLDATDTHSFQQSGSASVAAPAGVSVSGFSVAVAADGQYAVLGNFDALADGETATVTFSYTATDNSGAANAQSEAKSVTLLVSGTNDQAVVSDVSLNDVESSGTESFTGQLSVEDLDATDTHSFQQVGDASVETSAAAAVVTNFSVLLTAGGGYTIEGSFDALAEGETATVTFSYTATDDSGADNALSETKVVTLMIAGSNDQPVVIDVSIGDSAPVLEAGGIETFSGQLLLSEDLDATDTHSFQQVGAASVAAPAGVNVSDFSVEVATNGQYAVVGNFDALGEGETATVTFNYTATDDSGAANAQSEAKTVTLLVTGTNDQPVITDVQEADLDAREVASFAGQLVVEDLDATDTHVFQQTGSATVTASVAETDLSGVSVSVAASGGYTINGNFDALADGETVTVSFTYAATDDSGAGNALSEEKTVTLLIIGTNDQPLVSDVSVAAIESGGLESFSGQLLLSEDLDTTDTHSFQQSGTASVAAPAGVSVSGLSVVVTADGQYTVMGNFDALAAGETATVTFDYTATDDSGAENAVSEAKTVTLLVTGSNDRPIVTDVSVAELEGNGSGPFQGQLLVEDLDHTDSHDFQQIGTASITVSTAAVSVDNFSVVLASNGLYSVNGQFDALAAGETATVVFNYRVSDSSGAANAQSEDKTVTLVITGTNDQPVVTDLVVGEVAPVLEGDATQTFEGQLSVQDLDTTDTHSFQQVGAAAVLTSASGVVISDFAMALEADGRYTIDGNFDALAAGETATVSFNYTATDDSGTANAVSEAKTVSLIVTGTNDQPVIADVGLAATEGNGFESFQGQLLLSEDLDTTDAHSFKQATGASVVTSAEGVSISGFSVVVAADGQYSVNGNFDALAAGETATVTFTYTATDDSGAANAVSEEKTVTMVVTGSNDAPVLVVGEGAGTLTEDVDLVAADGAAFMPGEHVLRFYTDFLLEGDGGSAVFTRLVADTIAIADDDNWLDSIDFGSGVLLDSTQVLAVEKLVSGFLGDELLLPAGTQIAHFMGSEVINQTTGQTGRLVLLMANAGDDTPIGFISDIELNQGDQLFGLSALSLEALEYSDFTALEGYISASGVVGIGDRDATDTLSVNFNRTGAIWDAGVLSQSQINTLLAGISVDSYGWDYRINNSDVQFLAEGEVVTVNFDIVVTDNHGARSAQTVEVAITGANDRPVVSTVLVDELETNGIDTFTGQLLVSDADATDTHTFQKVGATSVTGGVGITDFSVVLAADGQYTVTGNFDALAEGAAVDIAFAYTATDDSGTDNAVSTERQVVLTVTGTNDRPVVADVVDVQQVSFENTTSQELPYGVSMITSTLDVSGVSSISDLNVMVNISHTWVGDLVLKLIAPDGTEVLLVNRQGVNSNPPYGDYGHDFTDTLFDDESVIDITAAAAPFTGSFRPIGSLSDFADLDANGTWTLVVSDELIGYDGTLNNWRLDFTSPLELLETEGLDSFNGWLQLTDDLDHTDSHTFQSVGEPVVVSSPAGVVITDLAISVTDTGAYTLEGDFNALAEGETATVSFDYTATDDSGAANATSVPKTVTITVTGTNDAPLMSASNTADSSMTESALQANSDPGDAGKKLNRANAHLFDSDVVSDADGAQGALKVAQVKVGDTLYSVGDVISVSLAYTNAAGAPATAAATLKVSADGSYRLKLVDKASLDALPEYQEAPDGSPLSGFAVAQFSYTVVDALGAVSADWQTANITVEGSNDRPVLEEVTLEGAGFETPALAPAAYQYNPTGGQWTFEGGSGVSSNASPFTSNNPAAPEGGQVAFLQHALGHYEAGVISQAFSAAAGEYTLEFDAAARDRSPSPLDQPKFNVVVDGVVVAAIAATGPAYKTYSVTFTVAADGPHTLAMVALEGADNDETTFIDNVVLTGAYPITEADGAIVVDAASSRLLDNISDVDNAAGDYHVAKLKGKGVGIDGRTVNVTLDYLDADDQPAQMSVKLKVMRDGSYTVSGSALDKLPEGHEAIGSFSYQISDGGRQNSLSNVATVNLIITGTNDAPVVDAVVASGLEDAASIAVTLGGDDADGSLASFYLLGLPANGKLYLSADLAAANEMTAIDVDLATLFSATDNTLALYFVPDADWNGDTSFTYRAFDNYGDIAVASATASIQVSAVNDAPVLGARVQPEGDEFRVNTSTASSQFASAIASLSDGSFVVTWTSYFGDGSYNSVHGQRYSAAGEPQGVEFLVNSFTDSHQHPSSISALSDGGFMVVWASASMGDGLGDDDSYAIHGQRYDGHGNTVGIEFLVNSSTYYVQDEPDIATLSDGSLVVTWKSLSGTDPGGAVHDDTYGSAIHAQRYTDDGSVLGDEFQVNSSTSNAQYEPAIAALNGGGFVVTWQSYSGEYGDASGTAIHGQLYNNDGVAQGTEFLINSATQGHQLEPAIAALSGGGFVVTWGSEYGDGSGYAVYGQRYGADGSVLGGEFLINSATLDDQLQATITGLSDGGFVVTWNSKSDSHGDTSASAIHGQRYSADGEALGAEFRVNSSILGAQAEPAITALDDGGFVVSWSSESGMHGDNSSFAVHAQRFSASAELVGPVIYLTETDSALAVDAATSNLLDASMIDDVDNDPVDHFVAKLNGSNVGINGRTVNVTLDYLDADDQPAQITVKLKVMQDGSYTVSGSALNKLPEGSEASGSFTYKVSDGESQHKLSNEITVNFTITGTNDAPVVQSVAKSGNEDANRITVQLKGSDADGDISHFLLSGIPANGILYTDTGKTDAVTQSDIDSAKQFTTSNNKLNLYFEPAADWNGETSFSYLAVDDEGASSAAATATINITPVLDGATNGNDMLEMSATNEIVNARGGDDTLLLGDITTLDFSALPNSQLKNIEEINLLADGASGAKALNNLSAQDVLKMTDGDNLLDIFGDAQDSVGLIGDWTTASVLDDGAADVYTATTSGGTAVTVVVEEDIVIV